MLSGRDRVVMISGATSGMARATQERLIEAGWLVSAGIRDARGLVAADRLLLRRYDAESRECPGAWVDATLQRFGALHALVNAAGSNPKATLADEDETALDALWAVRCG